MSWQKMALIYQVVFTLGCFVVPFPEYSLTDGNICSYILSTLTGLQVIRERNSLFSAVRVPCLLLLAMNSFIYLYSNLLQWVLLLVSVYIIWSFCICDFTYLLTFTCDPEIHPCGRFTVIAGHDRCRAEKISSWSTHAGPVGSGVATSQELVLVLTL